MLSTTGNGVAFNRERFAPVPEQEGWKEAATHLRSRQSCQCWCLRVLRLDLVLVASCLQRWLPSTRIMTIVKLGRKGKRGPSMFAYFFFKIQKFLKKYLQQTSYRVSLARTGSHGLLYQQGRLGTWEMGWSWLIWTTRHLWPETGDLGAWIKIRGLLSREKGWDKFWTHNEQGLPQVV